MKPIIIEAAVTDDHREHQVVKRFGGGPVSSPLYANELTIEGAGLTLRLFDFRLLPIDPLRPVTVTITQDDASEATTP